MIMMNPGTQPPRNGGGPTTMAIGEEGGGPGMPVGIRVAGPPPSNRPPQLPPPPKEMWGRPPAPQRPPIAMGLPPAPQQRPPVAMGLPRYNPPRQQPPVAMGLPRYNPPRQQPPVAMGLPRYNPPQLPANRFPGAMTTNALGEEGGGQLAMGPNQWLPFFNQGNRPQG